MSSNCEQKLFYEDIILFSGGACVPYSETGGCLSETSSKSNSHLSHHWRYAQDTRVRFTVWSLWKAAVECWGVWHHQLYLDMKMAVFWFYLEAVFSKGSQPIEWGFIGPAYVKGDRHQQCLSACWRRESGRHSVGKAGHQQCQPGGAKSLADPRQVLAFGLHWKVKELESGVGSNRYTQKHQQRQACVLFFLAPLYPCRH